MPTDQTTTLYVNGIDRDTGDYALPPQSVERLAAGVRASPGVPSIIQLLANVVRPYALPFNVGYNNLAQTGWGIVFPENTPAEVRQALEPLIAFRRGEARQALKVLDYKAGEQIRDWYRRHHMAPGNVDPKIVPYYLLLVGAPDVIPFEFQYLLGIEYAVGRLAFDAASDYEHYARSLIDYASTQTVPNAKEIVYWGTRHQNDRATELSASLLLEPLANGIPGAVGSLQNPLHDEVGYRGTLHSAEGATKANVLAALHSPKPPSVLFTASHGLAVQSGAPKQLSDQGALLCQDWPPYTNVRPEHLLAAADVTDDAYLSGMVAVIFACFGAGTPDIDQFRLDMSPQTPTEPLAPKPFLAALPRRLLTHPRGSALAVIGHVDRAWGYSIQAPKSFGPQIGPFRNSLGFILTGAPVGHGLCQQFGQKFASLSTILLNAISPTAPAAARLSDVDLVTYWLERNDAQNYVLLGDPAVRIRKDQLT